MNRALPRLAASVLALTLALCGRAGAEEVLVFAAASLGGALREIGHRFESTTGDRLVFNFAGSNDLTRQIRAGAPADVFFSANLAHMDELEKAGLVRAKERVNVLSNVLVVIVPASSSAFVPAPAALGRFRRLALANPDAVPAGIYARTWLQSRGVWEAVKDKVVPTLDVRAALAAVEAEHADAGIVYRTDAASSRRVRVVLEVPRGEGPAIVYPLAPIAASRKPGARVLVAYLLLPPALQVFRRWGFEPIAGK